jgi:hypothetical protein
MKHLSTYQIFEANVTDDPIEIITKLNKDTIAFSTSRFFFMCYFNKNHCM